MDPRSAFFSARNRRRVPIDLELDGELRHLEVRACSMAQRERIMKAYSETDAARGAQKAAVYAAIACLYDPDTDKPVFGDKDFALLYGSLGTDRPEGENCAALVEQVAMAASALLKPGPAPAGCPACAKPWTVGHRWCGHCGVEDTREPLEVAEKNSKTTPSKP